MLENIEKSSGRYHVYESRLTAWLCRCAKDQCKAQAVYDCVDVLRESDGSLARDENENPTVLVTRYCRWHGQCWAQDLGIEAPRFSRIAPRKIG